MMNYLSRKIDWDRKIYLKDEMIHACWRCIYAGFGLGALLVSVIWTLTRTYL